MRTTPPSPVVLVQALALVCAVALTGCSSRQAASPTDRSRKTISTSPKTTLPTTTSSTTSILDRPGGDKLQDGDQAGYLRGIDLGAGTVTVDIAELLTGPEAVLAYAQDTGGQALQGDPVYVRNKNPQLRTVPIDPKGSFAVIYTQFCCGPTSVTLDGLADAIGGGWQGITQVNPPFNLSVEGGRVTSAVQIYQP